VYYNKHTTQKIFTSLLFCYRQRFARLQFDENQKGKREKDNLEELENINRNCVTKIQKFPKHTYTKTKSYSETMKALLIYRI